MASAPDRLTRAAGERGPSLAERALGGVARLGHGTALHRLRLRGRYPPRLAGALADPVPGDPACAAAPARWDAVAHGFAWLRDMAALPPERARRLLDPAIRDWLDRHARFDATAWASAPLGERTLMWLAHAPLVTATPDLVLRSAFMAALARGHRHLVGCMERAAPGLPRARACGGAVAGALLLPDAERHLARAEAALTRALTAALLPDGGAATRSPADGLALAELLATLAAAYAARGRDAPAVIAAALAAARAALPPLVLGDGRLAAFHGTAPADPARVAAALAPAGPAALAAARGWHRLDAGALALVLDAGPPPDAWASAAACAATLAFELTDGPHRLIVNCGAHPRPDLACALRTTAAHSTVTVADTNSTRLRLDGLLGRGVAAVTATRHDGPEGAFVEAAHDGYRRLGLDHRRRLFLLADGTELRGEDALTGRGTAPFALRFHLGPAITAAADADGVTLAHPGGRWRLRARGLAPALEDSLAVLDSRVHATKQVVFTGTAPATVAWSLKRLEPSAAPA